MTTWFVSRHSGAIEWLKRHNIIVDEYISHLDVEIIKSGDVVIGSLPVNLAAVVCAKGARYFNLSIQLTEELRGKELSADQLANNNAKLEEFLVFPVTMQSKKEKMPLNNLIIANHKVRPIRHICIATGQNLANLIPAVQLGATDVIILETSEMTESAKFLSKALRSRNIASKKVFFDDSSPEKIQESASKIAIEFGQGKIVFNVTGGHKLMTLALATQLKMADELHVLYVETKKLRFDWLEPEAEMVGMQNVLKINDFLQVHGYSQKSSVEYNLALKQAADKRKSLTRLLGDESEKLGKFFGILNLLAHRALPKRDFDSFNAKQSLDFAPGGLPAEVLNKAQEIGLLALNAYGDEITFANEDSAKYFGGQWLEEYVASKLQGIQPFDYATSLVIQKNGVEIENECDAVVVHNNRLLLIECKTLKFGFDATKDADYIYKLSQLSNKIGGTFASKLLLSARLVPEEVKQRAKDYGVQILDASQVKYLVSFINNWKNS